MTRWIAAQLRWLSLLRRPRQAPLLHRAVALHMEDAGNRGALA